MKAHIEVSRPEVWSDFERFKIRLKDVLRRKEGWEKISMSQGEKTDLFELLSSGDIKPDADAKKAIQFLLGFGKRNEANIELPKEVKKELKPETTKVLENVKSLVTKKIDVKKSIKKEEVNVPCPAELVPGRPQCKVKGCTFIHKSIKQNEVHNCPMLKKDGIRQSDFTEQELELYGFDEAKLDGKSQLNVSGNNAFAIVYYPEFDFTFSAVNDIADVTTFAQEIRPGLYYNKGNLQISFTEDGNRELSKLQLTGTACWVKKHLVSAAHVFIENKGRDLALFDHKTRRILPITNVRSMVDRDIAIFTVNDSEFLNQCHASFARHRAVVADQNVGRKGVTLVKVDHKTLMPYCESGSVKGRSDVLGELSYDITTQYGDSGCIVYDSENGTVLGIHKGIDIKGSTNKCHTFRNENVIILHTQKPSQKSLN